jgi:hypothetical protein
MLRINKSATRVMEKLVKTARANNGHVKIDNDPYMPLSVEVFNDISSKYFSVSLCHYGKQCGDLMRDPEMCFVIVPGDCENFYAPYYFRNDYAGVERFAWRRKDGEKEEFQVSPREAGDQVKFANMWLRNIKNQGFIK